MNLRRYVRAIVCALVLSSLLAVSPSPALAQEADTGDDTGNDGGDDSGGDTGDDSGGGGSGGNRSGDGSSGPDYVDADAEQRFPGSGGPGGIRLGSGSSYFDGCIFERAEANVPYVTGRRDVASINIDGSIFSVDHHVIFCPDRLGPGFGAFAAYTFYEVGEAPPAAVIDALIQDAYSRTPVAAFNPITSPDGDEALPLVTQLDTFLWVDEALWAAPVEARASVPGFFVRTTARAARADWSGGEYPETCDGNDMEPYVFGIGGDEAQPSNCSTVYRRSSDVLDHEISVAATWEVDLFCSIPVCGGPLPDIVITSIRPVVVAEIQALESDGD